ncbi:HIT family protein [Bacillus sp. Marseille-Q3570]|uniref:HIT family protein n=1 Tax=Bacillus sp. Marseille-Q3570 TaxID=2963522 RepID=UPI0021B6F227|nr:HIT family protein [Bacillus sp. Marseille-Q3570]
MKDCPFCNPGKDPEQNIVFENEHCYFLLHPKHQEVLQGAGVIVPKVHQKDAFALTKEEWEATNDLLQKAKLYIDEKYRPDGYTLGWNVGEVSNQTILHAHFHIIPRYEDEPHAGKGLRYWLKQRENKRPIESR